jgi:uncharacterized protein YqjF (DUF2071 family)
MNNRRTSPNCPTPVKFAVMKQKWMNLAYVHWDYDPEVMQALLPPELTVDTYDGRAWVGLIPFSMEDISFPGIPPVPWLGSFPEVNVRTYVIKNGVPGVWFFSLDVNRLLPALVARLSYRLPYCFGSASNEQEGDILRSTVRRRWPRGITRANTDIEVAIGQVIEEPSEFEHFVSARWGLYSQWWGKRLMYAPVEHPQWELRSATVLKVDDSLITAAGLPAPEGAPHCMYSGGVPVRIGLPRRPRG